MTESKLIYRNQTTRNRKKKMKIFKDKLPITEHNLKNWKQKRIAKTSG